MDLNRLYNISENIQIQQLADCFHYDWDKSLLINSRIYHLLIRQQ